MSKLYKKETSVKSFLDKKSRHLHPLFLVSFGYIVGKIRHWLGNLGLTRIRGGPIQKERKQILDTHVGNTVFLKLVSGERVLILHVQGPEPKLGRANMQSNFRYFPMHFLLDAFTRSVFSFT